MICSLLPSTLQPDIVLLGAKDGKIKLINIDRGEAYKTINATPNAVMQMVALDRTTKPGTNSVTQISRLLLVGLANKNVSK